MSTTEKELLQGIVAYIADLMGITSDMLEKQMKVIRSGAQVSRKFDQASKDVNFWQKALKGLDPSEIGTLFLLFTKIPEMSNRLTAVATLPDKELENLVKEYHAVTKAFKDLKQKLSK